MKRRPSVLWAPAVAAALALTLATRAPEARADNIPAYRLTSSVDVPAAPAPTSTSLDNPSPQVVINVLPPGAVTPVQTGVDKDGNPTYDQPLHPLASSSGIDPNLDNLGILLKPPPGTPNTGTQQLGLLFSQGLKSAANGGHLDFTLSTDKALGIPVLKPTSPTFSIAELDLSSTTTGHGASVTTPPAGSSSGTTTTAPGATTAVIPEPLSVLLWSAVAGGFAVRAKARRRGSPA